MLTGLDGGRQQGFTQLKGFRFFAVNVYAPPGVIGNGGAQVAVLANGDGAGNVGLAPVGDLQSAVCQQAIAFGKYGLVHAVCVNRGVALRGAHTPGVQGYFNFLALFMVAQIHNVRLFNILGQGVLYAVTTEFCRLDFRRGQVDIHIAVS